MRSRNRGALAPTVASSRATEAPRPDSQPRWPQMPSNSAPTRAAPSACRSPGRSPGQRASRGPKTRLRSAEACPTTAACQYNKMEFFLLLLLFFYCFSFLIALNDFSIACFNVPAVTPAGVTAYLLYIVFISSIQDKKPIESPLKSQLCPTGLTHQMLQGKGEMFGSNKGVQAMGDGDLWCNP